MDIWFNSIAVALATIIGFSVHRASLCSVRAVEEILTTGRAFMLLSFIKSSLWVMGFFLLAMLFFSEQFENVVGWQITTSTFAGGLLFGIGATINGGCAFSTLTRLGSGNLGMLVSLVGFVFGAGAYSYSTSFKFMPTPLQGSAGFFQIGLWSFPLMLLLLTWMAWELFKLFRPSKTDPILNRLLSSHYKLSGVAVLMGGSSAFLYIAFGSWQYTGLLTQSARFIVSGSPAPNWTIWLLFAALVAGVLFSAWQGKRFRLQGRPRLRWIGYFCGGILMGMGASFIPGGNDLLILQAIPTLSLHAIPAFLAVLIGIAATLCVMKVMGKPIPKTDCSGDICKID